MSTKTNEPLERVTHTHTHTHVEPRNNLGLVDIQKIQIKENNMKLVM